MTQLIDQLISKGKLRLDGREEISVVFHNQILGGDLECTRSPEEFSDRSQESGS
ncbi:MAG: hypothetical protein ACUVTL_04645 [Thermoproteota archaeon]